MSDKPSSEKSAVNADKDAEKLEKAEGTLYVDSAVFKSSKEDDHLASYMARVDLLHDKCDMYYASQDCMLPQFLHHQMPEHGMSSRHVKERILQMHELDNRPRLNTSSYVNVVREPEEDDIALVGLSINIADGSVYPASIRLHDTVVNMIAKLWHAPEPEDGGNFKGAGTVGSTEACLLAGLALKFRWRVWYKNSKYGKDLESKNAVIGIMPNVIISTCYQACWEKFFRYFDVEPRFIKPKLANKMKIDPKDIEALCDEKTLGVVGVLGNHYNGAYDPIWEINDVVEEINKKHGYEIGIHVDAASGGFIAPFQKGMPPFDFRLKNVLSISASGHKFGESVCGTGWLVFRHHYNLAEHVAVSVSYLGGKSDSMTLNFSRPATATYVQLYKFLRLGVEGYTAKVNQQMKIAKWLRDELKKAQFYGKPRFEMLDAGDEFCLPVVAARLNPELKLSYNDIDMQHALSEYHWYVSGYSLKFEDPSREGAENSLCSDTTENDTMFRVVVKSNLALYLMEDLVEKLMITLPALDKMKGDLLSFRKIARTIIKKNSEAKTLAGSSEADLENGHHHLKRRKEYTTC